MTPDQERVLLERLKRVEAMVEGLAAALGGPAKEYVKYAKQHGETHPVAQRKIREGFDLKS